ncbi:MAG: bifunctional 3,4-dihydroxy-2-butanone-4-phosphate synthase/GTP cyclohydrolase II [Cytophagales bacterium]|nr:MAG: bifunctional 3,4-dihydroxy-2-butanone-4-phosphate synthase/GTP cyclohydrolase II [Cytophagales bacterium]
MLCRKYLEFCLVNVLIRHFKLKKTCIFAKQNTIKPLSQAISYLIKELETTKKILDSIEDALQAIRNGEIIIVVDDEDRENEGDFICAAETITPQIINFMAKEGRGLICAALPEDRCNELGLEPMVSANRANYDTAFMVSVDLIGHGCTTGISASDRAKTIAALTNPDTKPEELGKPGHIFPLRARNGGVLRRAGHTEAAVDFARLAGLKPAGVLVEIMNEDGSMARLSDLRLVAEKFNMKLVAIKDLIAYRLKHESLIEKLVTVKMPTLYGDFELTSYKQINTGDIHLALTKGTFDENEPVLVRVHSSCVTGDIFGSCRCDCGSQLHSAMMMVERAGKGIILYMNQEGRGIGLTNKLLAYKLQEEGLDTVEANLKLGFKMDARDYGVGAQILRNLGVARINLISNNPKKRAGLMGYGLKIIDTVPIEFKPNQHNASYLQTKRDKLGHNILNPLDNHSETLNLAIFASGNGSNAEAIISFLQKHCPEVRCYVFTNNKQAGVIERAKRLNVDYFVFGREDFYGSDKVLSQLQILKIDLLALAGFLWLVPEMLLRSFPERILNIHPSLLPKYGGKGMYGMHVHEAVIKQQETESGITIHLVNERFDEGRILMQARCIVGSGDTPYTLAEKIHVLEHEHYPLLVAQHLQAVQKRKAKG